MTKGTSVVVGGGIAGMLSAWLLARQGVRVILLEREAELGGLLRSFDYGEWGRFDYGAHNVGETGIAEIDELFAELLPHDEWNFLSGNRRDLAGCFYNGRLGTGSVYPDLRTLPPNDFNRGVEEFLECAQSCRPVVGDNAGTYLSSRFGREIGQKVLGPVVRKLFGKPASDLDVFATMLTSLDRVVLFDEARTLELYKSPRFRERLAFPDQRNLAPEFSSGRSARYPKHYGMYRVINALELRLRAMGVEILCGASVNRIEITEGRVARVGLGPGSGHTDVSVDGALVWTIGLIPLTLLLGRKPPNGADRPPRTVIVNFLLDRPLTTDLYYFYCYDDDTITFRVTNFSAFCDDAPRANGFPVCVEILLDQSFEMTDAQIVAKAKQELFSFGITHSRANVIFSRVEFLAVGFPMPSLKNVEAADDARAWLNSLAIENLKTIGIMSKPRLFFQKDILKEAHTVLREAVR